MVIIHLQWESAVANMNDLEMFPKSIVNCETR